MFETSLKIPGPMRAGTLFNLLLYPCTQDSSWHMWTHSVYLFNEWMNTITMAMWQVHVMGRSWASFLLTQPPVGKSKELHSAPGPHVQPFTLLTFSNIVCNPASALETLLRCLPGLIPYIQSLRDGEGIGNSWLDCIPTAQNLPAFVQDTNGTDLETCPYLSSGFRPPPPFKVS